MIAATGFALVASPLAMMPAAANTAGSDVVISEVYGAGGNSGAAYNTDFVELYNPTDAAISLADMSVQYRSSGGTSDPTGVIPLSGSIAPHSRFLVAGASGATGDPIPEPDATSSVNMSGSNGTVFLADQATALTAPPTGGITGDAAIRDLVGFGTSNTWEGAAEAAQAPAPSVTTSTARSATGTDTDSNVADFVAGTPSPESSGGVVDPPEPPEPAVPHTIAEIQGSGDTSPLDGVNVVTRGVVTAAYPTGGFNGIYIQTPGTGGDLDLGTHDTSDAVFAYLGNADAATYPEVGDYVEVTGPVSEFEGMTEVSPPVDGITELPEAADAPAPAPVAYPSRNADRESLEGMLLEPQGRYTVTDNYALNRYAEIGLARGRTVLRQPTDVARPGPAATAVANQNAGRAVTLDDGASTNFLPFSDGGDKNIALPYLTVDEPVQVGADVTFTEPVILDYRYSTWKFQPTSQLTADNADTVQPATFENIRTARPDAVGGDLKIASFNVLNYFTETGESFVADGGTCSSNDDRAGTPVTVRSCNGDGPRGAWDAANLQRQQDKIVTAINKLGADVVSLEEIENSAKYAGDDRRDDALSTLVDALNADAGSDVWEFVSSPSPASRPAQAEEDVIRTAFIYKTAKVETVGRSRILTGSAAFANAREPLGQVFKPVGGAMNQQVLVIVNHFKSKSSGEDDGTGQGNANPDRVRQATALVGFAEDLKVSTGTAQVFLTGDFNAYTEEDPMQVLYDAGYTDIGSTMTDESTYLFDGLVGSLDHMLANPAAMGQVTGADVWNINSVEPVALEYSRYNYNATNFYEPTPYRSSDHDPLLVGVDVPEPTNDIALNLLNINDFHGRIDSNTTKFATTVERLRDAAGEDSTLFLSAGDNIGASVFASSSANDNPTIDALNALGLDTAAAGNHEFDKGFGDLTGHVSGRANWKYLGANVYQKDTTEPALPEFRTFTVNGVKVGVIGAITEEAPSLVSPEGIESLDFGNPVEAVNRVAAELSDGIANNGEADVIVAEFHEGASEGTPEGGTLEDEVAAGGAFAQIVNETSPEVDAIFTGHTHKTYAWDAPVPGDAGVTRPIVQTGEYGSNVGQIRLFLDAATGEVSSYVARNVARSATVDTSYERVAEVKTIVDDAIAEADVKGRVPVGGLTADVTRAYTGGSYVDGKFVGPVPGDPTQGRDDRQSESALGNLVANSLVSTLSDPTLGSAEIGLVNPGGLRDELLYEGVDGADTNGDGVVTFAEANAVLPFVNNLWTLTLTGEQLKTVLEQQWQPDGSSRPFLHLGLSSNVDTTLDPAMPRGERVTSVRVNGEPLDMDKEYRIGTFSFLATGGDNFFELANGTDVKDSGLVDRDAWIAYLGDNDPVSPEFDRRQVYAEGLPSEIGGGEDVAFTLNRVNLTSLGSPENTAVEVSLESASGSTALGSFPVTDGSADVSFTAPASLPDGATVVATAMPSGTTVTIPTAETVTPPAATTTDAKVQPRKIVVGDTRARVTATVSGDGAPVTGGSVNVYDDGKLLGTAAVDRGKASVNLPEFTTVGERTLSVEFSGSATTQPSQDTVQVDVVKASPRMRLDVRQKRIRVDRTHPKLEISLTAPGQTVEGYAAVRTSGELVALVELNGGEVTATLPPYDKPGRKTVTVKYLGSSTAEAVQKAITVRVVR